MTRPLPDLDELERLAKALVEAEAQGKADIYTGMRVAFWQEATPQVIVALIAACRERDELSLRVQELDRMVWSLKNGAALATPEEANDE